MAHTSSQQLEHLRHSAAHLLAAAILELWPEAKLTLGPAIEGGFYYDIDFGGTPPSEKDLPKIEKRMQKILPTWPEFTQREVTPEEARELFKNNLYKLELIDEIVSRGEPITLYQAGTFEDLCRGGHVDEPSKILQNFKLLSLAGAYWRGSEKNAMLTRIYGTVFATKEELENHLALLKEAKKRDHRKLGKQLDLFTFSDFVGPGLPLFTPRGTIIREQLISFIQSLEEKRGFQRVTIPHLTQPALYKTSGHWDKFKDDLFHVQGRSDEFVMKPMNCPHHTQLYASRPRSYKELPVRFAEVTMVYRDEQAGQLQGLTRVRSITQDDLHLFCRPDQLEQEMAMVLDIVNEFYKAFNLSLLFRLSLRDEQHPEKYLGSNKVWQTAQNILRTVLKKRGADYFEAEGEAAFYGPKIDFIARDSLGRAWQMATMQLDFNMPARFELTYTNKKGEEQTPVMIHAALSGAIERFIGILLEHYAGNLPLWFSPTQVAVLPISDDQTDYAQSVAACLEEAGLRVEIDGRVESISKKIRQAELMKVPVMVIIGKKEIAENTVAVRSHKDGDRGSMLLEKLQHELTEQVLSKS